MLGRGFTLLELMVAISILAMAAAVLMGIQATGNQLVFYANDLASVTLLAQAKMQDLEYQTLSDGFVENFEQQLSGDFKDEGYPEVHWEATIEPVEISDETANHFVAAVEEQLFGTEDQAGTLSGAGMSIGQVIPLLINMLPGIINDLGQRIRLITLVITWEHLGKTHSFTLSQYIVQLKRPEEVQSQTDETDEDEERPSAKPRGKIK